MGVITGLNTSLCVWSSEHINCSVHVWMHAHAIARTILRSLTSTYTKGHEIEWNHRLNTLVPVIRMRQEMDQSAHC